jgi:hypothetical protein
MYNPKFARRKIDNNELYGEPDPAPLLPPTPPVAAHEEGSSPTTSEKAYIDIGKRRLEDTFNIDSYDLKPSLLSEEDRAYSFSAYLKKPSVRGVNTGITYRVTQILRNATRQADFEDNRIVETTERRKWKVRKQQLMDEIASLRSELRRLEASSGARLADSLIPPITITSHDLSSIPQGVLTELALLRKENYALRNMSDEDIEVKSRLLIEQLRTQIDGLEEENAKLRRQLGEHRDNKLVYQKPPNDIPDLNNLKRIPLEIDNIEKERVMKVLEDEWKYAASISRHGGSEPLRNPFERRRFINN